MNAPERLGRLLLADSSVWVAGRPHELPCSAFDAWWQVQDMWLRLLASHALHLARHSDASVLEWSSRPGSMRADHDLLKACGDLERYWWLDGERRRSLLQTVDVNNGGLAMTLAPDRAMRCWSDGPMLLAEIEGFARRHTLPR